MLRSNSSPPEHKKTPIERSSPRSAPPIDLSNMGWSSGRLSRLSVIEPNMIHIEQTDCVKNTGPEDGKGNARMDQAEEDFNQQATCLSSIHTENIFVIEDPDSPPPEITAVRSVKSVSPQKNLLDHESSKDITGLLGPTFSLSSTPSRLPVASTSCVPKKEQMENFAACKGVTNGAGLYIAHGKATSPEVAKVHLPLIKASSAASPGITNHNTTFKRICQESLEPKAVKRPKSNSHSGSKIATEGHNNIVSDELQIIGSKAASRKSGATKINAPGSSRGQLNNVPAFSIGTRPVSTSTESMRFWRADTWTPSQYAALAQACYLSFPFTQFEATHNKSRQEVMEVFSAVIQAPLLSRNEKNSGDAHGCLGEDKVRERRKRIQEVSELQKRYQEYHEIHRQREREEIKKNIEAGWWQKMHQEGWVKIEQAKNMLAEKEKEIEDGNNLTHSQNGRTRRGPRVMSVEEATAELQAASAELEKAKKAEQRKVKRMEKKDQESRGRKKTNDDSLKKMDGKAGCGKEKRL